MKSINPNYDVNKNIRPSHLLAKPQVQCAKILRVSRRNNSSRWNQMRNMISTSIKVEDSSPSKLCGSWCPNPEQVHLHELRVYRSAGENACTVVHMEQLSVKTAPARSNARRKSKQVTPFSSAGPQAQISNCNLHGTWRNCNKHEKNIDNHTRTLIHARDHWIHMRCWRHFKHRTTKTQKCRIGLRRPTTAWHCVDLRRFRLLMMVGGRDVNVNKLSGIGLEVILRNILGCRAEKGGLRSTYRSGTSHPDKKKYALNTDTKLWPSISLSSRPWGVQRVHYNPLMSIVLKPTNSVTKAESIHMQPYPKSLDEREQRDTQGI